MNGTRALVRLEALRVLRNRRYMIFTIALPILLYLAFGKSNSIMTNSDVAVKVYYMISMATLGAFSGALMGSAQRIAQERKEGWTRQLRLTSLPGSAYVVSKISAALITTAPSIVAVLLLGYFYGGVRLDAGWKWAAIALTLWIGGSIFAALSVAMGYRFAPDTVQPATMLVYLPMMFLGGVYFAPTGWLERVGKVLPTWRVQEISRDLISKGTISMTAVTIILVWLAGFAVLAAVAFRRDLKTS